MLNTTKTLTLLIFFISTNSWADTTCAPEDTSCQTSQAQLQAVKNSGAVPFKAQDIIETPAAADKKITDKQPESQPFKIPSPGDSQTTDLSNQQPNTNSQPQEKPVSATNIYNQNQEQPQFKYQPPRSPLQPVPPPQQPAVPVVIEYR